MRILSIWILLFCCQLGFAAKPKVALSDLPQIISTLVGQVLANEVMPLAKQKKKHKNMQFKYNLA